MGEFYSKRYFYKGGIGMTQSLKRFASAVLALVMAMTCLVFTNVASVYAADDASDCVAMGSYDWNSTALGGTAKTGTYNNMTYSVQQVDADAVRIKSTHSITFKVAQNCTVTATIKSGNGLTINGETLTAGKAYSLTAGTEYTIKGIDTNNTYLKNLTFVASSDEGSTETTTKATTTETTTETTTTTTTEATTEATTVANQTLYKYYVNAADATANGDSIDNNATKVFTNANTSNNKLSGESTVAVGGKDYTLNYRSSNATTLSIVVPEGVENATLYVVARSSGSSARALTLTKGETTADSKQSTGTTTPVVATYTGLSTGTYTLTSSGNMQYSLLVLSVPTTVGTTTTTTETTTETTTTTTTETTTEETTMGVLKVKVNNPASSSDTTVNVTVKRNGKAVSGVTTLNIGSETEIAGVNEDDVITFTFAKEQAKQITNWNSNLKSVFRDKTYTLTYTVGKTIAIPEMDYYSSMPAAVTLGQTETKAAGYGTYGFGQYKVKTNGNDLAEYAIIKGHQYSLFDVGSGDYDKDGTEFGIPDERILLLGGTDDEIELTNSINSKEKVLVLLDCSGDNAIVTATGGNLYSSYDGSTGTKADSITGMSKNGVKVQFYVDGGATITIKGTGTSANAYTVVKSIRLFNLNNIVNGDKKLDNGAVSTMTEDSPFYNVVTSNSLATTDKLFTLIGTVTGNHRESEFLNQIGKVGFVILDADTVDTYDKDGTLTPMQLKYNYPDVNFGGIYVETTDIYKNVYDATNYNSSLDSSEGYTGDVDSTLETNNNVAYFAELVSVSVGHRYYAYPYTLYTGATQRAYDTNPKGTRIEISNN